MSRWKKYRKKPVVIEAILFTGTPENLADLSDFTGRTLRYDPNKHTLIIETLEGDMLAKEGDFIIKGVMGEFYPCKPGIFYRIYEVAEKDEDV